MCTCIMHWFLCPDACIMQCLLVSVTACCLLVARCSPGAIQWLGGWVASRRSKMWWFYAAVLCWFYKRESDWMDAKGSYTTARMQEPGPVTAPMQGQDKGTKRPSRSSGRSGQPADVVKAFLGLMTRPSMQQGSKVTSPCRHAWPRGGDG